MREINPKYLPACLSIVLLPAVLTHGHNYLDPGTGSLLIQLAIGAVLGGWFVIKNYWARIKNFFTKRFGISKKDENAGD